MKQLILIGIISLVVGLLLGFFIGRGKTIIKETHTIEYKQAEPIKINIPYPVLVKETHTSIDTMQLPGETVVIRDTIYQVDTSAIVDDYMIERAYSNTFFDSKEQGRLTVNSTVQYNKQKNVGIDYQPVTKVETITKTIQPIWIPYVTGGYNTFNDISIGGGVFYHNIGVEYNFLYDTKINTAGHGVKLSYKF